jgi:glutathione synthase/RimK-type ligase-like ATP-grasp enzyme
VTLLLSVLRTCPISWLSNIERLVTAENKIVQYAAAQQLGLGVPRSIVTSVRDRIPGDFGDPLVVKPLGPGQFTDDDGIAQIVYASELPRAAEEFDALAAAPFLVQERLEVDLHLRVVTVVDRSWVCSLDPSGLPLDWRRVDHAHDAFVPTSEYPVVGQHAVQLARQLGLGYSSQDWVVASGVPHVLDVNPGGQWLFLPGAVSTAVTEAIAEWLAAEPPRSFDTGVP